MTRTVFSLALLLGLSGCLSDFGEGPTPYGNMTNADYAVLATVVGPLVSRPSDSVIVLQDSTQLGIFSHYDEDALDQVLLYLGQNIPALQDETMQDFKNKNLNPTYIGYPSKVHPACVRSGSTTRLFPWLSVGRVGFSLDGQQALAYVGYRGTPLGGYGFYSVLSRHEGLWTVIATRTAWILN